MPSKLLHKKAVCKKRKRPRKGLVKSSNRYLYLEWTNNQGAKAMPQVFSKLKETIFRIAGELFSCTPGKKIISQKTK